MYGMADEEYQIPIFLINGQLESGKTRFITETIEMGQFDEAKKGRILRFTNTLSHNRYVEDQPINDLSILGESPAVLTDLLSLMAFLDEPHCKSMEGAFE